MASPHFSPPNFSFPNRFPCRFPRVESQTKAKQLRQRNEMEWNGTEAGHRWVRRLPGVVVAAAAVVIVIVID